MGNTAIYEAESHELSDIIIGTVQYCIESLLARVSLFKVIWQAYFNYIYLFVCFHLILRVALLLAIR